MAWLFSRKGAILYLSCCRYTGYLHIYSTELTRVQGRTTSTPLLACPTTAPCYSAGAETLHSWHCRMQKANYFSADRLLKSRLTKKSHFHRSIVKQSCMGGKQQISQEGQKGSTFLPFHPITFKADLLSCITTLKNLSEFCISTLH